MLINALRDEKPTQIAVAPELDEKTFQHEQYVEYKANGRSGGVNLNWPHCDGADSSHRGNTGL